MRFDSGNARPSCPAWAAIGGVAVVLLALSGCAASGRAPAKPEAAVQAAPEGSDMARRAHIRMELAASYLQAGQASVALQEVAQAIALEPRNADAYALQGLILLGMRDYPAARNSLQQSLSLQPGDPRTLHNMGWLDCLEGRYAQGIAVLDRVLDTPRYAEPSKTLMTKAMCQRQAGDVAAAEKTFFQAYEMDAGNPVIAYHLADLLFRRQELERARFYVRRLNNGEYANAESLWLGIRVEKAIGDKAAVRQLADQLQKRFPDSKEWQRYEQGAFSG